MGSTSQADLCQIHIHILYILQLHIITKSKERNTKRKSIKLQKIELQLNHRIRIRHTKSLQNRRRRTLINFNATLFFQVPWEPEGPRHPRYGSHWENDAQIGWWTNSSKGQSARSRLYYGYCTTHDFRKLYYGQTRRAAECTTVLQTSDHYRV